MGNFEMQNRSWTFFVFQKLWSKYMDQMKKVVVLFEKIVGRYPINFIIFTYTAAQQHQFVLSFCTALFQLCIQLEININIGQKYVQQQLKSDIKKYIKRQRELTRNIPTRPPSFLDRCLTLSDHLYAIKLGSEQLEASHFLGTILLAIRSLDFLIHILVYQIVENSDVMDTESIDQLSDYNNQRATIFQSDYNDPTDMLFQKDYNDRNDRWLSLVI